MAAANKKDKDNATRDTEESSSYDSILPTCCCGDSFVGRSSIEDNEEQQEERRNEFVEKSNLWERVTDIALALVGAAPPVKIIKCLDYSSDDESEVTLPRVLTDLAEEYDKNNKWKVHSMWSISEDAVEGTTPNFNLETTQSQRSIPCSRSGSSRWGKLKVKRSSSSDRSVFGEDSILSKMRAGKTKVKWSRSGSLRKSSSGDNHILDQTKYEI